MIDFAVTVITGPYGPVVVVGVAFVALKVITDIHNIATGG